MTLTIEIQPQVEGRLRAEAAELGLSLEELATRRLRVSFLSDEENEDLEDEIDLAAVRRARLEDDPNDHKTLDDLRAALAQRAR